MKERRKNESEFALIGDVYAYLGKFNLAASFYQKANAEGKALMMYIDLRMFDKAEVLFINISYSSVCFYLSTNL